MNRKLELVSGVGSEGNSYVSLDSDGTVRVNKNLNYEDFKNPVISIRVRCTDYNTECIKNCKRQVGFIEEEVFKINVLDVLEIPPDPTIGFLKVGGGFVVNVTNAGGAYWEINLTSHEEGGPSYGRAIGPQLKIVHEGGTMNHGYSKKTSTIKVKEGRYTISGINYPNRKPGIITQSGKFLSLGDGHSTGQDGYIKLGKAVTFAGFVS
jgi:hypothetical protein